MEIVSKAVNLDSDIIIITISYTLIKGTRSFAIADIKASIINTTITPNFPKSL